MNEEMMRICEDIGRVYRFDSRMKKNRRGTYKVVSLGPSIGGGQKAWISDLRLDYILSLLHMQFPMNLSHGAHNADVMEAISNNPVIHRVANYGSCKRRDLRMRA